MPKLSLADFVDVVSASGTPKATRVRQVKARPPYSPARDFWKRLRDCIIAAHQAGLPKSNVDGALTGLTDKKKITAYPFAIKGYMKWWGNKTLIWFTPPTGVYSSHGVDISVNPELGLRIGGIPHLIKLYFKEEKLAKNRIDVITHLMSAQLADHSPPGTVMSVLDVRRSKLISPTVPITNLTGILDAELAYIAALWPTL